MRGTPDSSLRQIAANTLGELDSERAVEPLIASLSDPDGDVRYWTAGALGRLRAERAVAPLVLMLDEPGSTRRSAAVALGNIGSAEAVRPLIAALDGPSPWTRAAVVHALGQLADERAVDPLLAILEREAFPARRWRQSGLNAGRCLLVLDSRRLKGLPMKPNTHLDAGLVDNRSSFADPFFQRFELRPAPTPLELSEGISKTYSFPTFYADVTCAIAIFLCSWERAQAILPHPSMQPVKMPGGRSVVLLSSYEYKNVMNLAPYNEIAMTIPIMVDAGFSPPLLPLIMDFEKKGFYVFSMPVTSLENQIRGTRIWGLPKIVEEIDISTEGGLCTTTARDADGEVYLELSVPTIGTKKEFDETGYLYTMLDGKLTKSRTNFKGSFAVNTNPGLLWKRGRSTGKSALELGPSPRADILRDLEIEEVAFQSRYAASMNSCFDLPMDE